MKEVGILFKDRLVRGILADRKTQTRRVIKPQPPSPTDPAFAHSGQPFGFYEPATYKERFLGQGGFSPGDWHVTGPVGIVRDLCGRTNWKCPYGATGDRLWVREAWAHYGPAIIYRASMTTVDVGFRWKPGIHLCHKDARILLDVVSVDVQRLQDITEQDARAEGVEPSGNGWLGPERLPPPNLRGSGTLVIHTQRLLYATAREAFQHLWDSINGDRPGASWDANPWVWAVTFRRVTP